jgi:hypothetical protein
MCRCIAILWVSLVNFTAITLCVASQRVFIVVVYFVIDSVRKLLDTPSYVFLVLKSVIWLLTELNYFAGRILPNPVVRETTNPWTSKWGSLSGNIKGIPIIHQRQRVCLSAYALDVCLWSKVFRGLCYTSKDTTSSSSWRCTFKWYLHAGKKVGWGNFKRHKEMSTLTSS